MPADRFYHPGALNEGSSIELEGDEFHHLSRVMRISVGEEVELVNGKGALAHASVQELSKRFATLSILHTAQLPPPKLELLIGAPIMRPSKLEWIVEKCTELGADAFFFFAADYSEKDTLSENQLNRLNALTIGALKQSGRLYLPRIEIHSRLDELLRIDAQIFYGDTRPEAAPISMPEKRCLFISGPEKGFSSRESELLEANAKGVKLSEHILRAETAPLAATALFAYIERI